MARLYIVFLIRVLVLSELYWGIGDWVLGRDYLNLEILNL
ncbi:hypothetical protein SAMD00079811_53960 [Scytonema sp. HK-05]|nr:hypothetical protein SAMD00079811_53960 [Scytonema sp. HK-05]